LVRPCSAPARCAPVLTVTTLTPGQLGGSETPSWRLALWLVPPGGQSGGSSCRVDRTPWKSSARAGGQPRQGPLTGGGSELGSELSPGPAQGTSSVLPVRPDARVQLEPASVGGPQLRPEAFRHPGHLDPRTFVPPGPAPSRSATEAVSCSSDRRSESLPVFVAVLDEVHHDDPPSRPGVVAVSVSLRHQRSLVTLQRPPLASRRSATGRTRSPFCTTATGVGQSKTGGLSSGNPPQGGVQQAWRRATLPTESNTRS
jgi:hypothetical protein